MTRLEYMLLCLGEECAEVSQMVSKSLRFGLDEVYPVQTKTNAERLEDELNDLLALRDMLIREGHIRNTYTVDTYKAKKEKFENYLGYSMNLKKEK